MSDVPREPDQDNEPTGRIPGRSGFDRADEPVTGAPAGASAGSPDYADRWRDPSDAAGGTPASGSPAYGSSASGSPDPGDPRHGAIPRESYARGSVPSNVDPSDAAAATSGAATSGSTTSGSTTPGSPASGTPDVAASRAGGGGSATGRATGRRGTGYRVRGLLGLGPVKNGPPDEQQRRRRRWFLVAISVGAAVVVLALCAGALSIVNAVHGVRDRATEARDDREERGHDCLVLEERLNRLVPPAATTTPAARATAIRDENAAVRLYLTTLRDQRGQDGWRQLLDSRTVFADMLDRFAKSRTPAFYVAPVTSDGREVSAELIGWSPAPCAGPIRRLAAPDL